MMNYETITRSVIASRLILLRRGSYFILFLALATVARAQTAPMYLGGGISYPGVNLHSLNVPVFRGDTLCGVFKSGTSILPNGWIIFEKPLGADPAHSFWFTPRLSFNDLGLNTTIPTTGPQAQARNPVDSSLVNVTTINRIKEVAKAQV